MRRRLLLVFVLLITPVLANAQGKGNGRGRGTASADSRGTSEGFGRDQERIIRDWFSVRQNLDGLPPGLAKREQLPPGLQRQLERNGQLPPGLQKKVQPLPSTLETKLPRLPDGWRRVVIAGNVILMEERTARIVDILTKVF
jgi:hypothetical protein